ncbi:MAG: hypothetical protein U0Q22_10250 [Acidimicrobiales bacterium]
MTAIRDQLGLGPRDRRNPTLWESIALDPTLGVPDDSRVVQVRNLRRPSRHFVAPILRPVCQALVTFLLAVKRLPGLRKVGSPDGLSAVTAPLLVRLCSPETAEMLIRHFIVETQLVNFVARNSGSDAVAEVDLLPTSPDELGDHDGMNAVVLHDVNIFNLVIDLGEATDADLSTRPVGELDFSMLTIPPIDVQPGRRRWINLDVQSSMSLMCLVLAWFMDFATAERAINSFQLDESLMAAIASLTGDPTFRTWTPVQFPHWLGTTGDVARDLLWHFMVHEFAHTRLTSMATSLPAAS